MGENSTLTRHAGTVSSLTLVSRLAGLARDMVFAALFGAGTVADAFVIAFTIPNVFRRFLAEGALSVAFVPVFTDYQTHRTPAEVQRLYDVTLGLFSLVLLVVCGAGVLASPLLVRLFAPGFDPAGTELAVFLNRLMFPYLFFIGLTALLVGILNTHRHFAAPAAAPILLNLAIIGCALALTRVVDPPITAMAIGVLAGGLCELLFQVPFVRRRGVRLRPRFELRHPAVGKMLSLMGPAAFGMAVYQINILVSRALASLLPEGSVATIYYSDRFLELPLGVFAVAVATVSLPNLSRHAAAGQLDRFKETLRFALRLTLLVCIPAALVMAACRLPLISTLLQRGQFSFAETQLTAQVFLAAAAGIPAIAGIRNLVPAFYALHDTRTPVWIAGVSFLLNAGLGAILMWPLGPAGLTLANTISATANFTLLWIALGRKIGPLGGRAIWSPAWRVLLASVAAAAACWPFERLVVWSQEGVLLTKGLWLAAAGATALLVFLPAALLLRVQELRLLWDRLRRRGRHDEPQTGAG